MVHALLPPGFRLRAASARGPGQAGRLPPGGRPRSEAVTTIGRRQ
jgi:hypothetical protein